MGATTATDMNQGFVVAIELLARPGEEEAVAQGLAALIQPSLAEQGIRLFAPYRSPIDARAFFVFELYVDEEAWAAHQRTAHFNFFVSDIVPLLERRQRVPYKPFA